MPPEINQFLDSGERVEFAVYSKRVTPLSYTLAGLFFTFIWLSITGTVGFGFLSPWFLNESANFTKNGAPVTVGPGNWSGLLLPALIVGVFAVIGVSALCLIVYSFFSKGGWFVGTSKRLMQYRKGKVTSTNWDQFTGNFEMKGSPEKGNLMLELKTGITTTQNSQTFNGVSRQKYTPNRIMIIGIPNVFEIGKMCKARMEESKSATTA